MFVPCGESVPDLAGYTFLMVSARFLELRVLGLECFLSGGAWGAPTASRGVSPALGQRAVLVFQVFSLPRRQVVAGCGASGRIFVGAVTKRF